VERQTGPTDTPAAKLLKVTGNRALATNGELSAFRASMTVESLGELEQGLREPDWKVKVRAIAGIECFGDKFGWGTVAANKYTVEQLKLAPQASLRNAATRLHAKIRDVAPTELPSAFDLAGKQGEEEEVISEGAYEIA
jgi:hypothetical protein